MVRSVLLILMTALFLGSFVMADEKAPPQEKPAAEKSEEAVKEAESILRKARVDFLVEAIKHFNVRVGEGLEESKLHPKPLLVWNNPVSGTRIGIMAMFTRNDRPDVIAQFSFINPTSVINEFHNTFGPALEMKREDSVVWTPQESSTKWTDRPDADNGAGTDQKRLVQMRRIAESFVVEDNFGWDKKELHQLRLLPTPVYRYEHPNDEVVDGAVFVYALGTDPEAVLMLECVQKPAAKEAATDKEAEKELTWRYAFGPMSIYPLTAKLNEKVVWEIGERKQFGQRMSVQYVCPYQLAEGEKIPE